MCFLEDHCDSIHLAVVCKSAASALSTTSQTEQSCSVCSLSKREVVLESQIIFFIMVNILSPRRSPKLDSCDMLD